MRLSEKSITSLIVVMILATLAVLIKDKNYFHKPPPVSYCKIDTIAVSKDLIFPYIHCKDSIAEFKINAKLQLYYLHRLIGNDKDDIFRKINKTNRIKKFFFEILNNDEACLSIRFTKIWNLYDESFSSKCDLDTIITYRNFNPLTGDGYIFSDFLDTNRKKEFANIIASLVICRYFKPSDDIYQDSSDLFHIKSFYNDISQKYFKYDFYLQNNDLYLNVKTKNFPIPFFGNKIRDLSADKFINVSLRALNHCYSSFGNSFANKSDALKNQRTNADDFLLLASIGELPYLIICIKNENLNDNNKVPFFIQYLYVYDYDKKELLSYFNIGFEKDKIIMREQDDTLDFDFWNNNTKTFEFEQHGDTLIGNWISADKKTKLPFWAKRI